MTTLATILSIASGFVLMRYYEPPANLIATSIIVNLALTPGLLLGAWALAAVMIIPPSRPDEPRPDAPQFPPTSHAA